MKIFLPEIAFKYTNTIFKSITILAILTSFVSLAYTRETINIVGSSTVFPFSTSVAEQFGSKTTALTPIVESTGSGGGMKLFCKGIGTNTPDITNASRRMKKSEWKLCQKNGVKDIIEVQIGFDGIVLANSLKSPSLKLSQKQIFQALAAQLPKSEKDCTLIPNPNKKWSDIDPSLPDYKIEAFGPPPTSGTRDAFVEIAMENGAKKYQCLKKIRSVKPSDKEYQKTIATLPTKMTINKNGKALKGKKIFVAIAHHIREDGAWIDAGENDNAIVQTLVKTPSAIGIFGYSFLNQNSDRIKGSEVNGALPLFENIADGIYPISRSLYFYVKKAHINILPDIQGYINEFTAEDSWGDFGYLTDKGLIPLPEEKRKEAQKNARSLKVITEEIAEELH